jgi:hypothetical protein
MVSPRPNVFMSGAKSFAGSAALSMRRGLYSGGEVDQAAPVRPAAGEIERPALDRDGTREGVGPGERQSARSDFDQRPADAADRATGCGRKIVAAGGQLIGPKDEVAGPLDRARVHIGVGKRSSGRGEVGRAAGTDDEACGPAVAIALKCNEASGKRREGRRASCTAMALEYEVTPGKRLDKCAAGSDLDSSALEVNRSRDGEIVDAAVERHPSRVCVAATSTALVVAAEPKMPVSPAPGTTPPIQLPVSV